MINNIAAPSLRFRFPMIFVCCVDFGSASNACCLLVVYSTVIYCYDLVVFLEVWVIQQVAGCIVVPITSTSFFPDDLVLSYVIFYWLIKRIFAVDHNVVVFNFHHQKKILCVFCSSFFNFKRYQLDSSFAVYSACILTYICSK